MRLESWGLCSRVPRLAAVGLIAGMSVMSVGAAFAAGYGSFSGSAVDYNNVADVNGILGPPTLNHDALDFSVNSFVAASPFAGGSTTVSETLTFEVDANGTSAVTELEILLGGRIDAIAFVVDSTRVLQASGNLFVDIFEVDGQSINVISASEVMAFRVGSGAQTTLLDYFADPYTLIVSEIFTGRVSIDLDQVLAENGVEGVVTRFALSAGISLTALAEVGASSLIEINEFDPITTVVPEPTSAMLLGLGLIGLARRTRTKAAAAA